MVRQSLPCLARGTGSPVLTRHSPTGELINALDLSAYSFPIQPAGALVPAPLASGRLGKPELRQGDRVADVLEDDLAGHGQAQRVRFADGVQLVTVGEVRKRAADRPPSSDP